MPPTPLRPISHAHAGNSTHAPPPPPPAQPAAPRARAAQIRDLFARYGRVERCYLARDKETNESKGFAFVTFALGSEAERARQAVNGYPLDHLILRVEYARPSNKDGGGGGGGGPGGGGGLSSSGFVSGYGKALPQSRP